MPDASKGLDDESPGSPDQERFDPNAILTEIPEGPQQPSEADTAPPQERLAEPQPGDERRREDDRQDDPPKDEPAPFPDDQKQGFEALLTIGYRTDDFHWLGHHFVIRTLYGNELMDVGLLHKKYAGTLGDVKAYQYAVAAACLVSVDGQPPPVPLVTSSQVSDVDPVLLDRFNYATKNWFPPTVDVIYERYLMLEKEVTEALEAMAKA